MKSIIDRKKSTREVVGTSRRFALPTAAKLEKLLAPELEPGEALPDLELLQKLFGRALDRRWRNLSKADHDAVDVEQRHGQLLAERGSALQALYREVVDLRTVLRGIFGAAGDRFLCLKGETSRDPIALPVQAHRAVTRLRDQAKSLPPSTFDWNEMRGRWTAPVAAAAKVLRALDARARLATKEFEGALFFRQRALNEFNTVFVQVAGWLEGTYRAAGLDVCADAVRPSGQRPGRLLEEVRREAKRNKLKRIKKASKNAAGRVSRGPEVREPVRATVAAAARILPFPAAVEPVGRDRVDRGFLRQWASYLGLDSKKPGRHSARPGRSPT